MREPETLTVLLLRIGRLQRYVGELRLRRGLVDPEWGAGVAEDMDAELVAVRKEINTLTCEVESRKGLGGNE